MTEEIFEDLQQIGTFEGDTRLGEVQVRQTAPDTIAVTLHDMVNRRTRRTEYTVWPNLESTGFEYIEAEGEGGHEVQDYARITLQEIVSAVQDARRSAQ